MFVHEDEVRLDLAPSFFEGHLNIWHLAPARGLAVGDKVNLLAQSQTAFEGVDAFLDGGKEVGRMVAE